VSSLIDANIVSEWKKALPNPGVIAWLKSSDEDDTFISVVTLAEIRRGTSRLPAGRRRTSLAEWFQSDLIERFAGRILPVDTHVADAWGRIMSRRDAIGRPMNSMDAFIAATAEVHGLTLVTRNVSDFQGSVTSILNPWTD